MHFQQALGNGADFDLLQRHSRFAIHNRDAVRAGVCGKETAEAIQGSCGRAPTLLKQGVNENWRRGSVVFSEIIGARIFF